MKQKRRKMKKLKPALTICFSIILGFALVGCITTVNSTGREWEVPPTPITIPVKFEPMSGGFFLSNQDSTNLANNVDILKAHIEKLELMINTMESYYEE